MNHEQESALLESSSTWQVGVTAVSLGIVHVFSGPDHLGALVALANGRHWCEALALGAQWGCGHALGISAVTVVCLVVLDHAFTPSDTFRAVCNYLTGACLVLLGCWALHRAIQDCDDALGPHERQSASSPKSQWNQVQCQDASYILLQAPSSDPEAKMHLAVQSSAASVCVGVLHGAAGPGCVLAVLPALSMHHNVFRATLYLGCFCVSTISAMAAFAALYGELTWRGGRLTSPTAAFRIAVASSLLSMTVGMLWIALQATGLLTQVFGE